MDEPIRVLGLDGEDWLLAGSVGAMVYAIGTAIGGLIAGGLSVLILRGFKRGQPPGALRHGLWALGVPLPGWPPAPPREGRRYSPWR